MADAKYNMFRNSICSAVTSSVYNGWTDSDLDSLSSSERTIYYDSNIAFTSGDKSIVSGTSGDGSLLAVPDLYGTLRGLNTRINNINKAATGDYAEKEHTHDEYASVSHTHDEYASVSHTHTNIDNALTVNGVLTANDSIHAKSAIRFGDSLTQGARGIIGFTSLWSDGAEMTDPFISIGKYATDTRMRIYDSGNVAITGNLNVNGNTTLNNILRVNSNDYTLASFFNPNMSTDDIKSGNIYFGKSGSNNEGAFLSYSIDTNEIGIGVRGLGTRMFIGTTNRLNGNTAISGNLTAGGLDIGKFSIKTQGDTWASLKMNGSDWIGLNTETNNISVYKNLSMNGELRFNTVTLKDGGGRLNLSKGIEMLSGTDTDTKLLLGRTNTSKQCTVMTYSHSDVPQFKIGFWDNNGDDIIINTNKELTIKDATTIDSNLTVAGKLNGFKIGTVNNGGNYMANTFIPTVTGDGVMEVGKHIDFHAYSSATETNDYSVRLSAASNNLSCSGNFTINGGNKLALTGYNSGGYGPVADIGHLRFTNSKQADNAAYLRMVSDNSTNLMTFKPNIVESGVNFKSIAFETNNYIKFTNDTVQNDYAYIQLKGTALNAGELEIATCDDSTEPIYVRQYTGNRATLTRTLTLLDADGNTSIPGSLTINGDVNCNDCIRVGRAGVRLRHETGREITLYHGWADNDGGIIAAYDDKTKTYKTLCSFNSQTITHITNVNGEIGTFCETTGEIYDGYNKTTSTDCICQVKTSTLLNARIVGIICSPNEFASHGDCLVKVVPGDYQLGDILCPDENGYGRKATDEELMFMMLHAIPRPKITSLNTGIEGYVACFLV